MNQSKPFLTELELLDRLICALERSDEALGRTSTEEADAALADGLALLGSCYGSLDTATSPEASAHLDTVYDACLRGLGEAYSGNHEALTGALVLVRSVRSTLVPTRYLRRAA